VTCVGVHALLRLSISVLEVSGLCNDAIWKSTKCDKSSLFSTVVREFGKSRTGKCNAKDQGGIQRGTEIKKQLFKLCSICLRLSIARGPS